MDDKKVHESISFDSYDYRGCHYRGIPIAGTAISSQRGQRQHHAEGLNNRKVLGKTTFESLGVVAPTQDELGHVALDVTAAVVAGNESRKHTVGPNAPVYTLVEKDKAPYVTGTFEHGAVFVLLSDSQMNGRYEAFIYIVKIRRIAEASA